MKFSMTIVCSALVLALCASVESRGYGNSNYPVSASAHRGASSGCSGYGCMGAASGARYGSGSRGASAFGPYHSYAVRPVVYGGHGLYNYRGYARHYQAPANNAHQRYTRSYAMNAGGCSGYNCRSNQQQRPAQLRYGWRPVKALAIAPATTYTDNYVAPARTMSYGHGAGAARGNYRSNAAAASSAGRYRSAGGRYASRGGNRNHGSGGY